MEELWSLLLVYKVSIIVFVIGLFFVALDAKVIPKSEPEAAEAGYGVISGCVLIIVSVVIAFSTFRNQPLNESAITEALSEGDCVSQTLREVLSEEDEPLSRNHLVAIRDTCEEQQEKTLELAKKQRVLYQQRNVAEQHTSTISEEE